MEAFARVYELQSFSLAGKELFLSQPTVSTHISNLEQELGTKLFDRIGRKIVPTQAGEVLYHSTQKIFHVLTQTQKEIQELTHQVSGPVVIGGSTIPANYLLPSAMASFKKNYPDVCVDLRIGDSIQISQDVLDGNLDFGVVGGYAGHFDLTQHLVMTDELMVVSSPGLVAGMSGDLSMQDLLGLPWVIRERGSGTRQALEQAMQIHKVDFSKLQVKAQVQSTEALVRCVLAGVGLGVTSKLAVQDYVQSGDLVSLEVADLKISREFYLIKHKRRTLFLGAEVLLRHIKSMLSQENK